MNKRQAQRVKRLRIRMSAELNVLLSLISVVAACIAAYSAYQANQISALQSSERLKVLHGFWSGAAYMDDVGKDIVDRTIGKGICRLTVAIDNYGGVPATLVSYGADYTIGGYSLQAQGRVSSIHPPCDMCWADTPELVPGIKHLDSTIVYDKLTDEVPYLDSVSKQGSAATWPPIIEPYSVRYLTIDTSFWYEPQKHISYTNYHGVTFDSFTDSWFRESNQHAGVQDKEGLLKIIFSFETRTHRVYSSLLPCLTVESPN